MNPSPENPAVPAAPHPALAKVARWLEAAVIGLNLCPFAKAVHVRGQIRWVVLDGVVDPEDIRPHIAQEMDRLAQTPAEQVDTTLIILPHALSDFLEFRFFADSLSSTLKRLGLRGVLQVASFHPQFEFAGEDPQSVSHYTNRAPYPVIHLLREDSISRAVAANPDTDAIWQRNVERLGSLSPQQFEQVFPHGN